MKEELQRMRARLLDENEALLNLICRLNDQGQVLRKDGRNIKR